MELTDILLTIVLILLFRWLIDLVRKPPRLGSIFFTLKAARFIHA